MFGDLIYFNKKRVDQYSALILGKNIETRVIDKDNIEDISANYLLECSNFEKLLQRRDDFIDYVDDNQGISIKDVRISSIIKVTGEIYIPEQFDMVHLIAQYKDMIVSMLIDYNELEDYEGKELTIIVRLESRKYYRKNSK